MNRSYTEIIEEAYWDQWEIFDTNSKDETYDQVINFLNTDENFRSFGEGLIQLMSEKHRTQKIEDPIKFLKEMCLKNNVDIGEIGKRDVTLKSWFYGDKKPKKGDLDRRKMFALAFALEFTPEETAKLFHKVYLDRAFDFRNANEIIFYYCLSQKKSWQDAKRLIASIKYDNTPTDATIYTSEIVSDVTSISDEKALLEYIGRHSHNLQIASVTAEQKIKEYMETAKWGARAELQMQENKGRIVGRNTEIISTNLLYEIITGLETAGEKGTISLIKKARLPQEIKSRFPTAASLGVSESHENRRKILIMLYFYTKWFRKQWGKIPKNEKELELFKPHYVIGDPIDLDDYTGQLNALLFECGFSQIYIGNPYDWLFLFCCLNERPLDMFRGLMSEVLNEEE